VLNRRDFIKSTAAGITGAAATTRLAQAQESSGGSGGEGPAKPVVVASRNGLNATAKAMELLDRGADTLDAVIAGVNLVEADPEDTSVGYGGLPNENGVVQLDASVMHGPTHGAGAVASLEGIMYPSRVARDVMNNTDHVLLVGEGALKFALAMGYEQQNLLTDQAREIWLKWKRDLTLHDDWIDPADRSCQRSNRTGPRSSTPRARSTPGPRTAGGLLRALEAGDASEPDAAARATPACGARAWGTRNRQR